MLSLNPCAALHAHGKQAHVQACSQLLLVDAAGCRSAPWSGWLVGAAEGRASAATPHRCQGGGPSLLLQGHPSSEREWPGSCSAGMWRTIWAAGRGKAVELVAARGPCRCWGCWPQLEVRGSAAEAGGQHALLHGRRAAPTEQGSGHQDCVSQSPQLCTQLLVMELPLLVRVRLSRSAYQCHPCWNCCRSVTKCRLAFTPSDTATLWCCRSRSSNCQTTATGGEWTFKWTPLHASLTLSCLTALTERGTTTA